MKAGAAAAAGLLPLAIALLPAAAGQSQSASGCISNCTSAVSRGNGPAPLLASGTAVSWWFVFKFNGYAFPGCGTGTTTDCPFGGDPQSYAGPASLQYVYASSQDPTLKQGTGCAGETTSDPIGATYSEIYNGSYHYVVWNDQFYGDPAISYQHCSPTECSAPWGHSKGMVAWDDSGNGLVMQVTTPSWPASGSANNPRKSGNTLGCVIDNNLMFSQQFFALKLTEGDLVKVLKAMQNASVVTDPSNPQIVNNGGPAEVSQIVSRLGALSTSTTVTEDTLSSGVALISKPPQEQVPPWQAVSARLGGVSLRVASWWGTPNEIPSTTSSTRISCWDRNLGTPGAVEIATRGQWSGTQFSLEEGPGQPRGNANHAKIGVSTDVNTYVILGDMNQQGSLDGKCAASQNGRGGMFYVLSNPQLFGGVRNLISGASASGTGSSATRGF
ncbi:MAG: deoxyribonuclease II family protein [Candidatus Cybelea sp.]